MKRPIIIEGSSFDWDAGEQNLLRAVDSSGEVNWGAALAADPGVMQCPNCSAWLWKEGLKVMCPDCGHVFRPEEADHEFMRKMGHSMVKNIMDEIEHLFFSGMPTLTASTASSKEPTTLTMESFQEMIKALETPKPSKRQKIVEGTGSFIGMKIFVNPHCYKRREEWYGLADLRRPNNKKPLYRKRVVHVPLAFLTKDGIICHPSIEAEVRRRYPPPAVTTETEEE